MLYFYTLFPLKQRALNEILSSFSNFMYIFFYDLSKNFDQINVLIQKYQLILNNLQQQTKPSIESMVGDLVGNLELTDQEIDHNLLIIYSAHMLAVITTTDEHGTIQLII
jgi:hypothetical protein